MKPETTFLAILRPVLIVFVAVIVLVADPADPPNSIDSFVNCLNDVGTKGGTTIADTVGPCIPSGCRVIVTMGPTSAQAACTLGGCLLPRVIFECPGPSDDLKFRPSYLLCPINSKGAGGLFGTDRIEAGEDVEKFAEPLETSGKMKMADYPIPPGQPIKMADVLSVLEPDQNTPTDLTDSKDCNSCHKDRTPNHSPRGTTALSAPIDPFGETRLTSGVDGAPFVIDVSVNVHRKLVEHKALTEVIRGDGTKVENMTLDKICDCIGKNGDTIAKQANGMGLPPGSPGVDDSQRNPNVDPKVLLTLCRELAKKIQRAGMKGRGEFLDDVGASFLQFDISGQAVRSPGAFRFTEIHGTLAAYSDATRTTVTSVEITSLDGTLRNGDDFEFDGMGTAVVNGTPRMVRFHAGQFNASRPTGFVAFEIRDDGTGAILAKGAAHRDHAALELRFQR